MRTVAACEADPWRRERFLANFPGVAMYDDVRTLSAERLRADGVGPIDLVAGSPPCQDASAANTKGVGVDGERTGLIFEQLRIVAELRPRWVCVENSPRLRTRGIDRVLAELEALGYACWPLVVGTGDCGAPHERKRMWLVAADADQVGLRELSGWWSGTCGEFPPESADDPDADGEGELGGAVDAEMGWELDESDPEWAGYEDTDTDRLGDEARDARPPEPQAGGAPSGGARDADEARLEIGQGERCDLSAQLAALERAVGPRGLEWNAGPGGSLRMAYGLPAGLARRIIEAYGDAVVPVIPELIGRAIMSIEA